MNIHEYQAKQILASYKVPVPIGKVAHNAKEAELVAMELNSNILVVKAQIHAGGRGKAGGVKVVKTPNDVYEAAKAMLGMNLITHQTGPQGQIVKKIYIEEGSSIEKEYYLGIVVDRETSRITVMASKEGGVEIEEVAAKDPSKILKTTIDPVAGLQSFHARKIASGLGFKGDMVKKFEKFLAGLYEAFIGTDASQIEINPLVTTKEGNIVALDAKFNFDDNALYRHQHIADMRDEDEEDPLELRASRCDLSYVKMDGNIGCMVNGAGLAMATMDIIKLYGAEPANFLDVGGGATKERVTEAFKIILSDPGVKGVLVNIFGGIMRCDIIAEGILVAAKEVKLNVPLVVRLAGTNFELGKKILDSSDLKITSADDLADAAEKIVKAIKMKAA
jgi:succinyl-CoA synthetase beta subunit